MHFSFIGTTKEPIKIKGEPCIGTICIFQYIKNIKDYGNRQNKCYSNL